MYYIIYFFLYLFSLLPFKVLYLFSDFASFCLYHVIGYRKEIVFKNLKIAFPKKSEDELKKIRREFYTNFTDNFIETIKLLSMSGKTLDKRMQIDIAACNQLAEEGLNIQFNSGHQMNWEYASVSISKHLKIPWLAVYKEINTRSIERLFLKIRSKFGAVMVSLSSYKFRMPTLMKEQYALGLIADQNPVNPKKAYWLNFFTKPAPFLTGPDKGARRNKTAVVFVNIVKIKRGYFKLELSILTKNAQELKDGEIMQSYRTFLEEGIKNSPANYLWSHRRWKHEYSDLYAKKWMDISPAPIVSI